MANKYSALFEVGYKKATEDYKEKLIIAFDAFLANQEKFSRTKAISIFEKEMLL